MSKYVGNLIPHTFFVTKGSGESDLELHAGSYHMALHDAGISDFNIMVYSSVLPATAHIASMDEIDLPPFGSEMKTILRSHMASRTKSFRLVSSTLGCMLMRTSTIRSADSSAKSAVAIVSRSSKHV